jgi:hypothetical protein
MPNRAICATVLPPAQLARDFGRDLARDKVPPNNLILLRTAMPATVRSLRADEPLRTRTQQPFNRTTIPTHCALLITLVAFCGDGFLADWVALGRLLPSHIRPRGDQGRGD